MSTIRSIDSESAQSDMQKYTWRDSQSSKFDSIQILFW